MKLYAIPGGTWAGTEADWKRQMKAAGHNPKDFEATKTREIPTAKAELMEFLNFFAVDVYRSGTTRPVAAPDTVVDVEALRAEHNPDPAATIDDQPLDTTKFDLDAAFRAAPLGQQLTLASLACEAGYQKLAGK